MKSLSLSVLVVILIGVAIAIYEPDSSVVPDSPIVVPSQNSTSSPLVGNAQASSGGPPPIDYAPKTIATSSQGKPLIFPDGEVIEIIWRESMRPTVSAFGVDNYEVMRKAALSGDAIVSFNLSEMQRSCQSHYDSDESLEAAVDQLYQTHTIPRPDQERPTKIGDPEKLEEIATMMRSSYARCEKLLAYQGDFDEKWLERSANDGWPLAMIELGQQQDDRESARNLYQAAWDTGSVQSLSLLSEIIMRSYESGENPNANVEAFAVLLTYTIIETTLLKDQGRIAGRHAARLKAKLEDEQKLLLPQERNEALEMSKQMIRSNPNCCFGL
jgi:hypothetical protein